MQTYLVADRARSVKSRLRILPLKHFKSMSLVSLSAVLFALLSWSPAVSAQGTGMITDRPDLTDSPHAIPLGSVQIEAGFSWEKVSEANVTRLPEGLVRWSPILGLELRLGVPDWLNEPGGGQGFGDLGLGAKFELGRFGVWDAGVIAGATLPTGTEVVSSGGFEPQVAVTAGRDLDLRSSLGVQLSATAPAGEEAVGVLSTIVLGRDLSESVGSFIELAIEKGSGETSASLLHAGLTFSLTPLMQFDIHAAAGLSGSAPDALIGFGFSTRRDQR